jgi:hypothetical protein
VSTAAATTRRVIFRTVLGVAVMAVPLIAAFAGPVSAGVSDPACFRYVRDVGNNWAGDQDSYMYVAHSGGADAYSSMMTSNGHDSSYCGNAVSGWTAEALVATYYYNGTDYVLCGGPQPYQYISTTTGSALAVSICDGARYYRSDLSSRVWFGGVPKDSNIDHLYESW